MRTKHGYSLVSVLITTAVGGILAVTILGILDNASQVMLRGNALDAFEGNIKLVASVMHNKLYCDRALRGALATVGPPVNFTAPRLVYNVQDNPLGPPPGGNELNIASLVMQRQPTAAEPAPPLVPLMITGAGNLNQVYGGIGIQYIRFREKERSVGRGVWRSGGINYLTYRGEIEIGLRNLTNTPGGDVRRRIPYTAVVDPATREIIGCYQQDASVEYLCRSMGGTYDAVTQTCTNVNNAANIDCTTECTAGGPLCPAGNCAAAPAGQNCIRVYYVSGFTYIAASNRTDPICACRNACYISSGVGASAAAASAATGATAAPAAPSGN